MRTSANGAAVLDYFEECRLVAYPDPGSPTGEPWTIGFGATGSGIVKGTVWTQAQANQRLMDDLNVREHSVTALVHVQLTQGQFDALVLLVYNIGSTAFLGSTLLRLLNQGDYDGASAQFPRWNKNAGQPMRGLTRRRAAEQALFNGSNGADAIKIGVAAG